MSTNDRTIIVMGLHKDGPRAASYRTDMADVAEKDAAVWGLRVGTAETDAAIALAKELPSGELFPSAKMQLPVIKTETYKMLLKALKYEDGPAETKKSAGKSQEQPANPWNAITVGSTVLAHDKESGGFYAATVEKVSADRSILTCSWSGFPKLPHFTTRRLAVGLLPVVK